MEQSAVDKLHIGPRTTEELHAALRKFDLKWQHKADRLGVNDRICRF
jgi:hypothetical protein